MVRELVTKFTERQGNVQVQRHQAKLTSTFLSDEMKSAKAELDQRDAEITAYKRENAGRLPEQMQSNMQTLNSLQMQLATVNEMVNRNGQEKDDAGNPASESQDQEGFVRAGLEQTVASQAVSNERQFS